MIFSKVALPNPACGCELKGSLLNTTIMRILGLDPGLQHTGFGLLEVNQDPLGRQASRLVAKHETEIWSRPLADGTIAVGLFNRGRAETTITVNWSDLALSGPRPVRNLWTRRDEGTFADAYTASVPRHGAVMLRIGLPDPG